MTAYNTHEQDRTVDAAASASQARPCARTTYSAHPYWHAARTVAAPSASHARRHGSGGRMIRGALEWCSMLCSVAACCALSQHVVLSAVSDRSEARSIGLSHPRRRRRRTRRCGRCLGVPRSFSCVAVYCLRTERQHVGRDIGELARRGCAEDPAQPQLPAAHGRAGQRATRSTVAWQHRTDDRRCSLDRPHAAKMR